MKITIGICTFNRAHSLDRLLESLKKSNCPANARFEILIVDNNGTDPTAEIIEKHRAFFGEKIRLVREPQQGLSYARNRIIKESDADVIAYVDDDVTVSEGWLQSLVQAYERWPDAAMVGGKSSLVFPLDCPSWVQKKEREYLGEYDLGSEAFQLPENSAVYGLNMSLKKKSMDQMGLFRVDIGRKGRKLLSYEEIDYQRRVQKAGGKIYYDPEMAVEHHISKERLTQSWFLRREYWEARSLSKTEKKFKNGGKQAGLECLKKLGERFSRFASVSLREGWSSENSFQYGKRAAYSWGEMVEWTASQFS